MIDCDKLTPQVTWGTSPGMVTDVTGVVPEFDQVRGYSRADVEAALAYMGLKPGMKITDIKTFLVNGGGRNWVYVKILTDQDIFGIG
jgi:homoaconitase/3-isopropylmalate dehydratase large subunit